MNNKIWNGLRLLLGLMYVVFGLNFFFNFLPMPQQEIPQAAIDFGTALAASGYMMYVVKGIEITGGLLLLSGKAVPFALIYLAPITVNIVLFHAFLAPATGVVAYIIGAIHLYLGFSRCDWYRPLLK